jgi:hypothetical protein
MTNPAYSWINHLEIGDMSLSQHYKHLPVLHPNMLVNKIAMGLGAMHDFC